MMSFANIFRTFAIFVPSLFEIKKGSDFPDMSSNLKKRKNLCAMLYSLRILRHANSRQKESSE